MENVRVIDRKIGNYKTIQLQCNENELNYLEVTNYPDGDIVVSFDDDTCVFLTIEQLEKLVEELKE